MTHKPPKVGLMELLGIMFWKEITGMKPIIKQITRVSLRYEGEPLFSEMNTNIEIEDESCGQFILLTQERKYGIAIDGREWPMLREAIDEMVGRLIPNKA